MAEMQVTEILDDIEGLPTLPVVAQQILKLISMPRSNMNQIAAVIARDQAISARVVRLVNSAFFGLSKRISSIQHAIVILGLNTVKNLVLGVSVVKAFEEDNSSIFDRDRFWLHTFSTAQCAKLLAAELKIRDTEDFFIGGLLHDIGILVLDQFFHEEFVRILDRSLQEGNSFLSAEQQVLGTSHGDIGAYLGAKWKLPQFLLDTMAYHDRPGQIPTDHDNPVPRVVHAADVLTRNSEIGRFLPRYNDGDDNPADVLGIPDGRLDEITNEVSSEARELLREWMR
jgi:putative nucleotidyltransferase with HDIG domain